MICQHKSLQTLDTRKAGNEQAPDMEFKYLVTRKKRCKTCGERFRTFEMTEKQILDFRRFT